MSHCDKTYKILDGINQKGTPLIRAVPSFISLCQSQALTLFINCLHSYILIKFIPDDYLPVVLIF